MDHPLREGVGAIHANGAGNGFVRRWDILLAQVRRAVVWRGPTRKATLTLLLLLATAGVATAASVQVDVNADPKLCARFLADLRSDQVIDITITPPWRCDFVKRHAARLFAQRNIPTASVQAPAANRK